MPRAIGKERLAMVNMKRIRPMPKVVQAFTTECSETVEGTEVF